jgi:hypothetical protein
VRLEKARVDVGATRVETAGAGTVTQVVRDPKDATPGILLPPGRGVDSRKTWPCLALASFGVVIFFASGEDSDMIDSTTACDCPAVSEQILKRLVRAAVSGAFRDHAAVHQEAYRVGSALVAPIVGRIEGADWSCLGPRERMAAFTALWLLLHDLDENTSRSLAESLSRRKVLHRVFAQKLKGITSFALSDYLQAEWSKMTVFTQRTLPNATGVVEEVLGWLRGLAPGQLRGLDRLYVVERSQRRIWGEYLRVLANIVLVWRGNSRWSRLLAELTLYHEIGHHLDPDLDAPKPEREAFADRFAFGRFAEAHPMLGHRVSRRFTGPLLLGSRWKSVRDMVDPTV